jgi:hypothetical protein
MSIAAPTGQQHLLSFTLEYHQNNQNFEEK